MFVHSSNCRLDYKEERFNDPSLKPEINSVPLADQVQVDEASQSEFRETLGLTPNPDAYVPFPLYHKRRELRPIRIMTPGLTTMFDAAIERIVARINTSPSIRAYGKPLKNTGTKLHKLYVSTSYHIIADVGVYRVGKTYGSHLRLWFQINKDDSLYIDGCLLMGRISSDNILLTYHEPSKSPMYERLVPGVRT